MSRSLPLRTAGFTLVELAIVLVLVGLLIGGVLVGQSLIENAAIRGTIEQIETFNSGTTTFRARVHALPGDVSTARAAATGLSARSGVLGQGDGNSQLRNGSTPGAEAGLGHETALYWRDLWDVSFIPYTFTLATDAPAASITTAAIPRWIPPSKVRASAFFHAYAHQGRHYYYLGGFGAAPTDGNGTLSIAEGLRSSDAFHLDEKLDDGLGDRGTILAITSLITHAVDSGTGASGECLNTDNTYNTDGDDGAIIACSIAIRSAF